MIEAIEMSYQSKQTHVFKVVILGESRVGKTSILLRFLKNQFNENLGTSIGAVFFAHTIEFDNYFVKLDIWDTAGQERYDSLAPIYYKGADAAIIVYDITSQSSLSRAQAWVDQLEKEEAPQVMAFIGNKCDCEPQRKVPTEVGRSYAQEHECLFMETSAKQGTNIRSLFDTIARALPHQQQQDQKNSNTIDPSSRKSDDSGCKC
ncbi:putative Vacuolar protein sorting-associated protein 21 [Blattamonas nauphoetae]|uniref:Vacuolar protein sorting-associated protein 21 n=1 Tax=Blattamonas nauphoetae TaxID=2049346 RepID=A0ABQ9XD89_9EUKA|nr:putative Vacuolar protein sorting-associated protein 21 [Blattamonas nauphoetae]